MSFSPEAEEMHALAAEYDAFLDAALDTVPDPEPEALFIG